MIVFEIEDKINQLFEEVYPHFEHGDPRLNKRGFKPLLSEAIGFIVPDNNVRRQCKNREYFKVDLDDFIEFSTSELTKESTLDLFTNDSLQVYSFLVSDEAGIFTEYCGDKVQVALLDVIIARHMSGVSVTARIAYKNTSDKAWIGFDNQRWEELVTLYFFPSNESHPGKGQQLLEWERYVILCPLNDNEWRFVITDGPYPEYLSNEISKSIENSERFAYVKKLVESSKKEIFKYAVQIEIARLCLYLPQYINFMYDLISTERVRARKQISYSGNTSKLKNQSTAVIYKIVKSINVIRSTSEIGSSVIKWTSPHRQHLVSGHWRVYENEITSGKDPYGNSIAGKTWVKPHARGKVKMHLPDIEESNAKVIVNVKRTLESARDEIKARTNKLPEVEVINVHEYVDSKSKKPTREWMADERAKLTAGLRYLILKRDNFSCKCCGVSPVDTNGISLEVDHILPIEKWGRTQIDNLQTLCKNCNRGKGTRV